MLAAQTKDSMYRARIATAASWLKDREMPFDGMASPQANMRLSAIPNQSVNHSQPAASTAR